MADIVERLREKAVGKRNNVGDLWGDWICNDAADTIESLRDEVKRLREAGENMAREVCTCDTSGSVSEALRKWNEALRD